MLGPEVDRLLFRAAQTLGSAELRLFIYILANAPPSGLVPPIKALQEAAGVKRYRITESLRLLAESGFLSANHSYVSVVFASNSDPSGEAQTTDSTSSYENVAQKCAPKNVRPNLGSLPKNVQNEELGKTNPMPSVVYANQEAAEKLQITKTPIKEKIYKTCTKDLTLDLFEEKKDKDSDSHESGADAHDADDSATQPEKVLTPQMAAVKAVTEAWREFDSGPMPDPKIIVLAVKEFGVEAVVDGIRAIGPRGHLPKGYPYLRAVLERRAGKEAAEKKFVVPPWVEEKGRENEAYRDKLMADIRAERMRKEKSNEQVH